VGEGIKKPLQTINTQAAFAFTKIHSNSTERQRVLSKIHRHWPGLSREDRYAASHSKPAAAEWQCQSLQGATALRAPYLNIVTHLGSWLFLLWSPACPINSTRQTTAPTYSRVHNTPSQSRWSTGPSWPCRSTKEQGGLEWLQRTSFCPLQD